MPCIIIKTNQSTSKEQQVSTCESISLITASLLGKPESYVMTLLEGDISMTMSGTTEPAAYVELKSINLPEDQTTEFSRQLCQHISERLNVMPKRIYIEFTNAQRHLWGWDSRTF